MAVPHLSLCDHAVRQDCVTRLGCWVGSIIARLTDALLGPPLSDSVTSASPRLKVCSEIVSLKCLSSSCLHTCVQGSVLPQHPLPFLHLIPILEIMVHNHTS